jgi:hypothetical protein
LAQIIDIQPYKKTSRGKEGFSRLAAEKKFTSTSTCGASNDVPKATFFAFCCSAETAQPLLRVIVIGRGYAHCDDLHRKLEAANQ